MEIIKLQSTQQGHRSESPVQDIKRIALDAGKRDAAELAVKSESDNDQQESPLAASIGERAGMMTERPDDASGTDGKLAAMKSRSAAALLAAWGGNGETTEGLANPRGRLAAAMANAADGLPAKNEPKSRVSDIRETLLNASLKDELDIRQQEARSATLESSDNVQSKMLTREAKSVASLLDQAAAPDATGEQKPPEGEKTLAQIGAAIGGRTEAGAEADASKRSPLSQNASLAAGRDQAAGAELRQDSTARTLTYSFNSVPGNHSVQVAAGNSITLQPSSSEAHRQMVSHQSADSGFQILPARDEQQQRQEQQSDQETDE